MSVAEALPGGFLSKFSPKMEKPILTPKQTLYLALPLVALVVLLLTYFRLFSSPVVIAILVVFYVAVSLRNRRKFARQGK